MKLDLLKTAQIGFQLIPLIVTAVKTVEKLFKKDPEADPIEASKVKQDAAVELVGDLIPFIEGQISKDVVDDSKVQEAVRAVIDAIVALFNVVRDVQTRNQTL